MNLGPGPLSRAAALRLERASLVGDGERIEGDVRAAYELLRERGASDTVLSLLVDENIVAFFRSSEGNEQLASAIELLGEDLHEQRLAEERQRRRGEERQRRRREERQR